MDTDLIFAVGSRYTCLSVFDRQLVISILCFYPDHLFPFEAVRAITFSIHSHHDLHRSIRAKRLLCSDQQPCQQQDKNTDCHCRMLFYYLFHLAMITAYFIEHMFGFSQKQKAGLINKPAFRYPVLISG